MTRSITIGTVLAAMAAVVVGSALLVATTTRAQTMLEGPTSLSPANGAVLTQSEFTAADWSDVEGTSTPITYRYESSFSSSTEADGSFSEPLFESGALASSSIGTAGTAEGTYYWHARAVDAMGSTSPWSPTFAVVVDNDATTTPPDNGTTTPPTGDAEELAEELMSLQDEFPQFFWNLQWVINDLLDDGGTTPPAGSPSIDNDGTTVQAGGTLDFVGRNFGQEEDVSMTLSGTLVRTVHADGGGNFSTGSMSAPTAAGTYTYVFTGQESGRTANSVITVQ